MADQAAPSSFTGWRRVAIVVGIAVVLVLGVGAWYWLTAGRESTDDAQVDAQVTPIAFRISGTVLRVHIADNKPVEAGAVLVELDPRDYEVAVAKARAELADAEASAAAAQSGVPITTTAAASNVSTAQGSVEQSRGAVDQAQKELEAAQRALDHGSGPRAGSGCQRRQGRP